MGGMAMTGAAAWGDGDDGRDGSRMHGGTVMTATGAAGMGKTVMMATTGAACMEEREYRGKY